MDRSSFFFSIFVQEKQAVTKTTSKYTPTEISPAHLVDGWPFGVKNMETEKAADRITIPEMTIFLVRSFHRRNVTAQIQSGIKMTVK